jgi:hypothetical protein
VKIADLLRKALMVLCRSADDIPTMALIQRARLRRRAASPPPNNAKAVVSQLPALRYGVDRSNITSGCGAVLPCFDFAEVWHFGHMFPSLSLPEPFPFLVWMENRLLSAKKSHRATVLNVFH